MAMPMGMGYKARKPSALTTTSTSILLYSLLIFLYLSYTHTLLFGCFFVAVTVIEIELVFDDGEICFPYNHLYFHLLLLSTLIYYQ